MFQGSIVALVTPMSDDFEIDFTALAALVEWHIEAGTGGLVIAGTTGESATLTPAEFDTLIRSVVEQVAGRIPVIAGTGGPGTEQAAAQTRLAAQLGADAVLVVTPYYNRPPQRGMLEHFRIVASAADLPVILYNVPSRTSIDLHPETVEQLAAVENIVAIKEACVEPGRIAELVRRCDGQITVLSGDDPSCTDAMFNGARGVVSVAANIAPAPMATLCKLALGADQDAALAQDRRLHPVYAALALETNPIPVKHALAEMGRIKNKLRLPLTTLAEPYRLELAAALTEANLQ